MKKSQLKIIGLERHLYAPELNKLHYIYQGAERVFACSGVTCLQVAEKRFLKSLELANK